MALAQIDRGLKSFESAYAQRLLRWQDATIARIVRRVRAEGAIVLKSGLGIHGSVPELRNELLNLRERIANFGRGQLNDELGRQEDRT